MTNRTCLSHLRLALSCLVTGPAALQAQTIEESVERYVRPYVLVGDYAGVTLLADSIGVQVERAFGRESEPPLVPRSLDARYRIGSVSKQFTAAAILLLVEDGRLSLSEAVNRWLPEHESLNRVTPHQLLTHTAGVPDIYELKEYPYFSRNGADLDEILGFIASEPLHFEPGSSYAYSNGGYLVLARLVEITSGQSFEAFLRDRILDPLDLADTGSEPSSGPVVGQAPPYDPSGRDGVRPAEALDMSVLLGAGSLYSSARDLYRWLRALHSGKLLSAESWKAMTTDHGSGYGYGLSVYTRGGRPVVGHDGRVAGGISDVTLYLDDGSVVVVVGNVQSGVADEFRRDLNKLLVRVPTPTPRLRETRDAPRPTEGEGWQPSPDELARLSGSYRFHAGLLVHVREKNGRLWARANEGAESELVPMEPGVFFSRMLYANIEFEADSGSRRLVWNEAGNRWVGELESSGG